MGDSFTLGNADPVTYSPQKENLPQTFDGLLTIHVGDVVVWINKDTDDHTVVSDDFVNTAGPVQGDHLLPGTDSNHG